MSRFVTGTTARLSLSYLAIIMAMSIGFSVVFFNTSAHELDRPPRDVAGYQSRDADDQLDFAQNPDFQEYMKARASEGRHMLLLRLVYLNLFALIAGSLLSYILARRTLEPIEENIEAQAQFVSDASHELRTPLTALQTTNEVALRKSRLSAAETRDLLGHNVAEVAKLQALTDGLLKLARADTRHVATVPVSLQAAAGEAMNTMISAAQSKRITIEDNVPDITVLADKAALAHVLAILLDNAVKYSPHDSRVRMSGERHGRHGFVSVADSGQGIAAADLPHIFDRFYRADESRNKSAADGYGIGLSLAKKLAHQMEGEILATSEEGDGSIFTVKLPLA